MIEQPSLVGFTEPAFVALTRIVSFGPEADVDPNPMVRAYGYAEPRTRCRECEHLFAKHWDKRYYKCDLRGNTNGPGTDHRVRWNACSKFSAAGSPVEPDTPEPNND